MVKCFVMIFTKNHAKTGYVFVTHGALQTCRPYGAIRIILFYILYPLFALFQCGTFDVFYAFYLKWFGIRKFHKSCFYG